MTTATKTEALAVMEKIVEALEGIVSTFAGMPSIPRSWVIDQGNNVAEARAALEALKEKSE